LIEKNSKTYAAYLQILKEELVPAMGCTEPIAIAYCAAVARDTLSVQPESVLVEVSGNILKNARSVTVPNTNGLKGIEAAAAAGITAGKADRALEVISEVTEVQKKMISDYLKTASITVHQSANDALLEIDVTVSGGGHTARVRISGTHTNIVLIEKDGYVKPDKTALGQNVQSPTNCGAADRSLLNVQDIYDFAESVELDDIRDILERQIVYNAAIAEEGLKHPYGANIGKVLMDNYGRDVKVRARAMAAAGSDARMSGCELPVIINSGSGNQGITASLPVIEYARELGCDRDKLYRALVISNLCTIHLKTGIGRLSAYCGVISAGCGAGAAIAYLLGGNTKAVSHTIVNALAIASGIVCDGAKPSCAAKIAAAVDAGILGCIMYRDGQQFRAGDGIISKGVENTISNINRLGRDGMKETDREIIQIMLDC
jgi:L-cysteine desulfidase